MPETPDQEIIDIDYFKKLRLRVGKVIAAENIEKSNKLLKLTVSFGDKTKTILGGIKKYYSAEDMLNKKIVVLDNLKPAKLMGLESQGMLLCAIDKNGELSLLSLDRDVTEGSEIS
jgi:methionyl-tRNA synthetase